MARGCGSAVPTPPRCKSHEINKIRYIRRTCSSGVWIIGMHGRSGLLRRLWLSRLQFVLPQLQFGVSRLRLRTGRMGDVWLAVLPS